MKIVYVNPFFTEGMGYIENCLPKAMAKRGHEVHIVTSTGKVYFNDPMYERTYEKFFGPPIEKAGSYYLGENLTLHRLEFSTYLNTLYLKRLRRVMEEIKPDVVHMWDVIAPFTLQIFILSRSLKFNVYTGNHYVLSVLDVHKVWDQWFSVLKYKWLFFKKIPGKMLHSYYKRCYAATIDAKFVAEKYMGVPPEKCYVTPLGVDTDVFKPAANRAIVNDIRRTYGFQPDDFVVLYTGRFAPGKNPLVLAQAIDQLNKKGYKKIKGLFVGSGDQGPLIASCESCFLVDFVPYYDLYKFYQIADLGVWPAQESTSMLDAAASGIPIIVNNTIHAKERYEGNGLTYQLGDVDDLAKQIVKLYDDEPMRISLGEAGRRKMNKLYSWDTIAQEREDDYHLDLKKNNTK
jgi:glycosyltransferase involved in cell wall biosynthesis